MIRLGLAVTCLTPWQAAARSRTEALPRFSRLAVPWIRPFMQSELRREPLGSAPPFRGSRHDHRRRESMGGRAVLSLSVRFSWRSRPRAARKTRRCPTDADRRAGGGPSINQRLDQKRGRRALDVKSLATSVSWDDIGGLGGNRTPVQGFAVLCVTTPPRGLLCTGGGPAPGAYSKEHPRPATGAWRFGMYG
jgi:hypothetical protein